MFAQTGYSCAQVASGAVGHLGCHQLSRDITAVEAHSLWTRGLIDLIVDVRSPSEYASVGNPSVRSPCGHGFTDTWDGCEIGHIPGAVLVPLHPWNASSLLPCRNMTIATACYNHASHPNSTWRSNTAAALLEAAGFPCVFNIVDGAKGWRDVGLPVRKGAWPPVPNPKCTDPAFYRHGTTFAHVGGFEGGAVVGGSYCDASYGCTHRLGAHAGEPTVVGAARTATELGFETLYADTLGADGSAPMHSCRCAVRPWRHKSAVPAADLPARCPFVMPALVAEFESATARSSGTSGGAHIGVVDAAALGGTSMQGLSFPEGSKGFQINARGVDGFTYVCFDTVHFAQPSTGSVRAGLQIYVAQAGWHEELDRLRAWVDIGGGQMVTLLPGCSHEVTKHNVDGLGLRTSANRTSAWDGAPSEQAGLTMMRTMTTTMMMMMLLLMMMMMMAMVMHDQMIRALPRPARGAD
jgi:rhodanese-related sulfurtransferase